MNLQDYNNIKDFKYLKSKEEIISQIILQSRIFNLCDYFEDRYIKDSERDDERAAVIYITRKNRYNLIVNTGHIYASNRLTYVLYNDCRNKLN